MVYVHFLVTILVCSIYPFAQSLGYTKGMSKHLIVSTRRRGDRVNDSRNDK